METFENKDEPQEQDPEVQNQDQEEQNYKIKEKPETEDKTYPDYDIDRLLLRKTDFPKDYLTIGPGSEVSITTTPASIIF